MDNHTPGAVRETQQRERAVVIGSGFGGGVSALRLGQAGVSTLVLERGRRWPTGPDAATFPTLTEVDNRTSWLTDHSHLAKMASTTWEPYTGLIESVRGTGMTINCGAGVGGGSLMYHGMTLQPRGDFFAKSMPLAADDYDELDRVHYPEVARMLQISTVPPDVLAAEPYRSSRMFLDVAPKAGLETFHVPLPVDWDYVRGELDGRYKPSFTHSDPFGINNGGKHSIDVTYLAAAEATGNVRVAELHVVRDISMGTHQRWVLHVDRIDTAGVVQERIQITSDAVFLNAGSAGTTRLLVKARAKGLIPDLPDAVGTQWGSNGDRIYTWVQMDEDPGRVQGGPACVGGRDLTSPVPFSVIHAGTPQRLPEGVKVMTLVGFGIVPPVGTWAYDPVQDDAHLTWPEEGDAELLPAMRSRIDQFAGVGGGQIIDTNTEEPSTWHALGGVPMGDAVDRFGRVLGHRGLYVTDGARIPGSTGACNPSMTIAAMAEHSMSRIVAHDVGPVF